MPGEIRRSDFVFCKRDSRRPQTTVTVSSAGAEPPAGFATGDPPTYYDISTTAVYDGPLMVCINYTGVAYSNEINLRLFHFEGGAWVDRTSSLDTSIDRICASVASLSPFDQHRVALARALVNRPQILIVEDVDARLSPRELAGFGEILQRAKTDLATFQPQIILSFSDGFLVNG